MGRDSGQARQRLGLPADKRIVLLTTQAYAWFRPVARAVFQAAKGHDDWLVCLKPHPVNDPVEAYRQIAADVGAANVRFFESDLEQLIAACDVLISGSSTTVFQAILMERNTICVNFSQEPDWYPYVADGGSLAARSDVRLREALTKALGPADQTELAAGRHRFLARHAGPSAEGQAALPSRAGWSNSAKLRRPMARATNRPRDSH